MYLAAKAGHLHICEWLALVGAGADILVEQSDGKLPLYAAMRMGNATVAKWLMLHGGVRVLDPQCACIYCAPYSGGRQAKVCRRCPGVNGAMWDSICINGMQISGYLFMCQLQCWAEKEARVEEGEYKRNLLTAADFMRSTLRYMSKYEYDEGDDSIHASVIDNREDEEWYWGQHATRAEDEMPLEEEAALDHPDPMVSYYGSTQQGRCCGAYRWQEEAGTIHFAAFKAVRKQLSTRLGIELCHL